MADSERASKRLPVTERTKRLIDEDKPDGMTYDLWIQRNALGMGE